MADVQAVAALQELIAPEVFGVADSSGKSWSVAQVRYGIVGGCAAPYFAIDGGPGNPDPSPVDAYFDLYALRQAMASDNEASWFTAVVEVRSDGQFSFNFEYDDEPDWCGGPHPSHGEYERDLRDFPRSKEEIPSWFPDDLK